MTAINPELQGTGLIRAILQQLSYDADHAEAAAAVDLEKS
jgi:hypothetical protein